MQARASQKTFGTRAPGIANAMYKYSRAPRARHILEKSN